MKKTSTNLQQQQSNKAPNMKISNNQSNSNNNNNNTGPEKLHSVVEKQQQALLRAYTAALEEHRLVVVVLLGVILFMSALFSLLFLVNLRLARDHQLAAAAYRPQRVRLLFDEGRNQIAVEWYTRNRTSLSMVWYGTRAFTSTSIGFQQKRIMADREADGGRLFKHLVLLGDLIPGINYQYKVGSEEMVSEVHYFKVPDHRLTSSSSSSFTFSSSHLFRPKVIDPEELLEADDQQLEQIFADSAKALDGVLSQVLDDLRRVDSLFDGGLDEDDGEEEEVEVTKSN
ncbi:hypothetical protein TYRP_015202 [Tyrophagus putrescentiae]|nr:hypothetical protein TYRP_015202 [Tyrophagus putrescentiae]